MAGTVKTEQVYYTKDFGYYINNYDNFVANQELTVTITLNEYRKLIEKNATSEAKIDDANSEKYKAKSELDKAEKENAKLKEMIFDLQNKKFEKEENDDECEGD